MKIDHLVSAALRPAAFVLRGLGPVGWIGLGALLFSFLLLFVVTPSVERVNATQTRELDALNRQLMQLRDPKVAPTQRDPLVGLIASLPASSEVPEFVASLQRRADAAAVQIDRTEYRTLPVVGEGAKRYRLNFPAHVDYPHLRVWLEGLLHDYPSLAIDELSLRREVDGGEELEAHVALSFLAREAN